jgi:septal ring factor EnvC (AmiA/AmiB activator)
MYLKLILFFVAAITLSSCATVESPSSSPSISTIPSTPGILHIIQNGETLWRISRKYDTDLDDILKANKISDSANISVGQTIVIPKADKKEFQSTTNFASKKTETDFIWPTKGKLVVSFKQKNDGIFSKGMDILTGSSKDVIASRSGKVSFVGHLTGYGKTLIIDHEDGYSTVYSGNSVIFVKNGDMVPQGFLIAKTGDPLKKGACTLHFEIRKKYIPRNPLFYLGD